MKSQENPKDKSNLTESETLMFETSNSIITILDPTTHRDFIKSGLSVRHKADASILIVSAAQGEFEKGISSDG